MLAVGTTTALFAFTSGAGAAYAAPGDTSSASGQALSGSLFDLPLSAVLDLGAASATNDGTEPTVTDGGDIDLTALSLLNVQLPGGLTLPLNIDAEALTQTATANPDGSSAGSSGVVGGIEFSLGGVLGGLGLNPLFLNEVAELDVSIGALSAEASQAAPAAAVREYTIADADLSFESATLGSLIATLNDTVDSTQGVLDGLEVAIEANLLGTPGLLPGVVDADVTVTVPSLADTVSDVLTTTLSSGGVTIDLTTGLVSVDLAVLNDLNNLGTSANLLGDAQLAAITANITSLVDGLVTDVGTALQGAIDGVVVDGGLVIDPPLLPAVDAVGIDNVTLGALLAGDTAGLSVLDIPLDLGALGELILEPLLSVNDLGNVVGLLNTALLTPVITTVVPAISPVLNAAIGLTANVQTTDGGEFSVTALQVEVLPAGPAVVANVATATVGPNAAIPSPTITSIVPDEGPESGGTEVTLTGTDFTNVVSVTIGGNVVTDLAVTPTTIVFDTPAHVEGPVDVVINALQGDSSPVTFTYLAVPATATSLDPDSGSEAGGTPVTITGSGFIGATGVSFDGTPGTDFLVVDDTTVTVVTPAGEVGPAEVIVTDPAGNSAALAFEYLAVAAEATSLTPTEGPVVGGTPVTITGSGFLGATGVTFDDATGSDFVVVDDSTITVTSPAGDLGDAEVVVLDPIGDSEPLDFEYVAQSAVATSLTPDSGTELGGTLVTISGSGFLGATAVEFDGTSGIGFEIVDDTTITVETPAHAPGPVEVVVIDPAGDSAPLGFTFVGFPSAVSGIDPDEGPEAGGTLVTVTGTGFTGAGAVEFDGIPGTEFEVVDDSTITVVSPAHAPGTVELVVIDGSGDSAPVPFTFLTEPSDALSLDPDSGDEVGGTPVTITGTGFLGATAVEFDGTSGTDFVIVDDTTITVVSPGHAPGTVDVVVVDGEGGDSEPLDFEYLAVAAEATSIDPATGPVAGGTVVTIIGSGFTGSTGVTFDDVPGTDFEVVSDTEITVTSPVGIPGTAEVVVVDPDGGNSEPLEFLYVAAPAVATSLSPTSGTELGGTPVTIIGSGFLGASGVEFDGITGTSFEVVSDTEITVTTPAHTPAEVDVVVIDGAGNSAPLAFTFVGDPAVVDTVSPNEGPEAGGTTVTIEGTGFTGATGVEFDGIPGTDFTVVDDTTIVVTTPEHLPGTVDVVVLDPTADSDPVDFDYLAEASDVSSLSPSEGPEAGGTVVTITGSGFLGATGVEFDGLAGGNFTVVDDSTITVTSPAHEPDLIGVVVLDPAGDSAPDAFEYLAVPSAAATLDPTFGPAAGGTVVTVTGSGFTGATGVEFDGIAGTDFAVVDDGTITVTTPAHPSGIVEVIVLDPAGDSEPLDFEYDAEPASAASITPVSGSEAGGTEVTISGSGFTGATGVTFDGIAGTAFTVVDDETVTVVTPAHAPGPVDVIVVDGAGSSEPLGFTYVPAADVGVVDPSTGPEEGGTAVTITGTCFTGATSVRFGDVEVTDFEVSADGTTITVISPAGVGTVDVTVVGTAECGTATEEGGYTYEPAPSVIGTIEPGRGPQTGGTTVTIIGGGFTGSTGVDFGGIPGTDFTVVDDTTITVVTPPSSGVGSVEVVVLDPAGNSAPVEFEYFGVAGIDTVAPDSGPGAGGTTVTISGQCFTGATAVRFGDTLAESFSVNAAGTRVTAVTPAGSGTVDVTVVGTGDCGSADVEDGFEYVGSGLPNTGVEIVGAALAALLLLLAGAAALVLRRREPKQD